MPFSVKGWEGATDEQSLLQVISKSIDIFNRMTPQVPTEYFLRVLGRHLKYSCCLYGKVDTSLDDAEEAMLGACQALDPASLVARCWSGVGIVSADSERQDWSAAAPSLHAFISPVTMSASAQRRLTGSVTPLLLCTLQHMHLGCMPACVMQQFCACMPAVGCSGVTHSQC